MLSWVDLHRGIRYTQIPAVDLRRMGRHTCVPCSVEATICGGFVNKILVILDSQTTFQRPWQIVEYCVSYCISNRSYL